MPLDLHTVRQTLPTAVPMVGTLGLTFQELTYERAVMELQSTPAYHNHIGGPHAGALGAPKVGLPAGRDKENPPSPIKNEPYKTHLAYVKERRTEAEAKKILEAALQKLRGEEEE